MTQSRISKAFDSGKSMRTTGQGYVAALAELYQFQFVSDDKTTLTHILSGVQVASASKGETAADTDLLRLTFGGGHDVLVIAAHYLELMLSEDAAHRMHSARDGEGQIHERARKTLEHLARKHDLAG